jgi:hypothetical protein
MSNKKSVKAVESIESIESKTNFGRIFPIGIVVLLAVGVFGAVGLVSVNQVCTDSRKLLTADC